MKYTDYKIENGNIVYYLPFQLKMKSSKHFKNIINTLRNCPLCIVKETYNDNGIFYALNNNITNFSSIRMNCFKSTLSKDIREEFEEQGLDNTYKIKNSDLIDNSFTHTLNVNPEDIIDLGITPKPNGIEINFKDRLVEDSSNYFEMIVEKNNRSKTVFGQNSVYEKCFLGLYPLYFNYTDKTRVMANTRLDLFSNGMGVIVIDIPLVNQQAKPFLKNNINEYFSTIEIISLLISENDTLDYKEIPNTSINEIAECYLRYIFKLLKCNLIRGSSFTNIIISKFDKSFSSLNSVSSTFKELVYRITNAPVDVNKNVNTNANSFWNESFFGDDDARYYFSSTGACFSICSDRMLNQNLSKGIPFDDCCYGQRCTLDFGIDYPIELCLFKKLNNESITKKLEIKRTQLIKLKNQYLVDENYILELQDCCYGTVYELIEKMEQSMPHFFRLVLVNKKLKNLENIINLKKADADNKFSTLISICGFIFTCLFALPIIKDTLFTLKYILQIGDIIWISINVVSFILWSFLNVIFAFLLFKLIIKKL